MYIYICSKYIRGIKTKSILFLSSGHWLPGRHKVWYVKYNIYIYIYTHTHIYICVCVCVCVCERERERERERE